MIIGFSCRQVSYLHHLDILARYYWGQGLGEEKSHLGISGAFPRHRPSTTAKNGAAAKFMTLMHALFVGGAKQGLNNIGLKKAVSRLLKLFPVKNALFTDDDVLRTVTKNDDGDGDDD